MSWRFNPFTAQIEQSSSGGGNATVPVDVPVSPPQAFVDNCANLYGGNPNFGNKGITFIDPEALSTCAFINFTLNGGDTYIDLAGNALSESNINAILNFFVINGPYSFTSMELSLVGPQMAAPTGQGLLDKATLEGEGWGWIVETN